jgi:hypothetical protein
MSKSDREVERLSPELRQGAEVIRAALHAFRLRRLPGGITPAVEEKIREKIRDGRVQELALPLISATPAQLKSILFPYLVEVDQQHRQAELTGWESDYVRSLESLQNKVENGKLSLKDIQDGLMVILEIEDRKRLPSTRTISKNLRSLGFQITRVTGGTKGIEYDSRRLERLKRRFISTSTSFTSFIEPEAEPVKEPAVEIP